MNDLDKILQIVSKVPELVEAAQIYKDACDKAISTLATAIKQQPEAVIPEEETKKLANCISQTKCALPDTEEMLREITEKSSEVLSPIIYTTVQEAVAPMRFKVQHEHTHISIGNGWKLLEEKSRKWILGLSIAVSLLLFGHLVAFFYSLESELILGRKCWEVYTSEYVTQEEKQVMSEKLYGRAVYPSNYRGRPFTLRKKLKENREILKQRRKEKRKRGEYSTDVKVEF